MQIIVPSTITLLSSSVPENDHAAWVSGATYAVGDLRIRTSTHAIYERLTSGAGTAPPESDPINWQRVGSTNRWSMFDERAGSSTTAAGTLTVTISPGLVRALALLDVDADTVEVSMSSASGGGVVYSRTVSLIGDRMPVDNWWDWSFDSFSRRRSVVLTDLPPLSDGEITITLAGVSVSVGTCVVGALRELGGTRWGVGMRGIDYSVRDTDAYGTTTLVPRANAITETYPVEILTPLLDVVVPRIRAMHGRLGVFIGSSDFDSMLVYGFMTDWSVDVSYPSVSYCSLTVQSLT